MTSEEFMQFLAGRRTYRRFAQKPVPQQAIDDMLEAARTASCGANRQTLKYLVVASPEMVQKTNALVHWAAYLPPEQGTPSRRSGRCCLWRRIRTPPCPAVPTWTWVWRWTA